MTEETLNDYVNKIQSFNMNEDKRFDAVHIKDAVMAGYNICRSECEKGDLEVAIRIGALEKENAELKKKNLDTQDAVTMQMYTNKANKEIADRQLTKAKEILNKFVELKNKPCASGHSINMLLYENISAEAEQFLNSEVEK